MNGKIWEEIYTSYTRWWLEFFLIIQGASNSHAPRLLWKDATRQMALMGDEAKIKCIFAGK